MCTDERRTNKLKMQVKCLPLRSCSCKIGACQSRSSILIFSSAVRLLETTWTPHPTMKCWVGLCARQSECYHLRPCPDKLGLLRSLTAKCKKWWQRMDFHYLWLSTRKKRQCSKQVLSIIIDKSLQNGIRSFAWCIEQNCCQFRSWYQFEMVRIESRRVFSARKTMINYFSAKLQCGALKTTILSSVCRLLS